ncbi:MAG: transcription elongation GreA/GreB family factor [Bacteriovoracaceae bacterium]|jgi:transcription elongation GreA/GreB family factor
MKKEKILKILIKNVQNELDGLKAAYDSTHSLMTAPDMKSEGKYDTRGIEAGYLAGAQKARVTELETDIQMLEEIKPRSFKTTDEVAIGALVELKLNDHKKKYFISPTAGGTMLEVEGESILVISVFSPIGSEVLSLKVGDNFELETKSTPREYEIIGIE